MLARLSIRDVVLVDRLDLAFPPGLSVLTGETGAGKSILLDALGLALGARADSGLVRHGAERAVVTAMFEPPPGHPCHALLADHGIDAEEGLVLRRTVAADGGSRAFANDQPATAGLLRRLSETLVEIQGQFEQRGLLDAGTHRALLDAHGGLGGRVAEVGRRWAAWQSARAAEAEAVEAQAQAKRDEDYLRHALAELDAVDPKEDEEETLAEARQALMNREKLVETIGAALDELGGDRDVASRLQAALREVERLAGKVGGALDEARAALDRAAVEATEAADALHAAGRAVDLDGERLEVVEERLFRLRELARKHRVAVAGLPGLRTEIAGRLATIDDRDAALAALARATAEAGAAYRAAADDLHDARAAAAGALDRAVMAELPPLKLEKAVFETRVERQDESAWGPAGVDRVAFFVAANPGTPPGPLAKVASGGELSRLMLALRVALTAVDDVPSLIFDEVDSGIGGATAAAVGERLARLARDRQVLVVTHSPQVAARGDHHVYVVKRQKAKRVETAVSVLAGEARQEEIARMLSGRSITAEARAAARSLLAGDAA